MKFKWRKRSEMGGWEEIEILTFDDLVEFWKKHRDPKWDNGLIIQFEGYEWRPFPCIEVYDDYAE